MRVNPYNHQENSLGRRQGEPRGFDKIRIENEFLNQILLVVPSRGLNITLELALRGIGGGRDISAGELEENSTCHTATGSPLHTTKP